jgi:hypothetical protein
MLVMENVRNLDRPITPGLGDSRRALRRPVKLKARLRDRGSTRFDIDVLDLSLSGFRAETAYTLHPGTAVWITLPGFAGLEATVAWQTREQVGCAFRQPLHPAVYDHILELARH